jgi:hypothetical protein
LEDVDKACASASCSRKGNNALLPDGGAVITNCSRLLNYVNAVFNQEAELVVVVVWWERPVRVGLYVQGVWI